jgi:hypothetical protein
MKNKRNIFYLLALMLLTVPLTGCFIYHKPEFKGQVVDAESKQAIEGAVVVAVYSKMTMGIPEHYSSIINVRETLTDKEGKFRIPSYTTIIQPFSWGMSWGETATFTIFKPGYASMSDWNLEENLTKGMVKEDAVPWFYNKDLKFTFAPGIIGLPKLKTREERLKAMPSIVGESPDYKKQTELIKVLNFERRELGLHGEY